MTGRIPKIVVVGSSYVDIAVLCDEIPVPGQAVSGSGFSCIPTGPGPNQAMQAAMCGCQVHLVSKVGGDPLGVMIKQYLSDAEINTDFVGAAEAKNTGTIITLVNTEGENTSVTYTGANRSLLAQDIDAADQIISEADVCLIHGRLPQQTIVKAIRCATVHRTKVILNPARPLEETISQGRELPQEYFSVGVIVPNLYEAADITEHSAANIRTAKIIGSDLVARGAGSAVITMGKRGCMVVDRTGADHIPAFVIDLVDKTCTGDAFAGALAAGCAVGDSLREAVKFASAAGALVCTKLGAIEALPTKAEIIELLQKEDEGI